MSGKRISFFTSPIGLGHATRDAAVAAHLRDADISFTSGGGAARLLADARGSVRDAYRPPRFEVDGEGRLRSPARWLWRYYRYYRDCKRVASDVIIRENPDVVVSDEDFASIAVAQKAGIKTVLITDILQTHFVTGRWPGAAIERRMNVSMREMIKRCDAVIMPEAGSSTGNIFRVGPITRRPNGTREEIRRAHKFEKKIVLVSVGGTDAGAFLIDRALDATAAIGCDGMEPVIVTGPSIAGVRSGGGGGNKSNRNDVRVITYVDNLHELILAADVLVSLAGRSTIDEAAAAGTPSVFIPIAGHFEQEENAARCGFTAADANRLAEIISAKLGGPRAAPSPPAAQQGRGAKEAAMLISSHIRRV